MTDSRSLETFEFHKVLSLLAEHASFAGGRELALALAPTDDLREAQRRQQETSEARRLLMEGSRVHFGGVYDVRPYVAKANRSVPLLTNELLEVRTTLLRARSLQQSLTGIATHYPRLAEVADRMQCCPHVAAEIDRCVDDRAAIKDSASPDLSRIRRELREAHVRLLSKLETLVASSSNATFLQEPLVTQRHGRYVVPLKAEFKGRIPGLIHDQSASGATVFIEPFAVVELGNRWRQRQLDEERELRRILAQLTELVADEAPYIKRLVETLAELDLAFTKARFADATQAVQPKLVGFRPHHIKTATPPSDPPRVEIQSSSVTHPGVALDLRAARHPLLDPDTVVPIDVFLSPDTFVLIITGPNTGGKTVALKTVGLLALMAQSGLGLPAGEGTTLSVFDGVYADIGDEQSIEQSLSTFSSHMTNIVRILHAATSRSLVILDELGAGTDPEEGAALARGLLSHLIGRGVATLTATHYSELKAFAHVTPGVQNASVEFDVETLSPTFELSIGLPGRSNALAIARRLGLQESILAEAGTLVRPESTETEALLEDIRRRRQAARQAQEEAEATHRQAQAQEMDLRHRLRQIEVVRREVINEARAEARELLQGTQEEVTRVRQKISGTGDLHERWLAEAEAELARRAAEAEPLQADVDLPAPPPTEPFRLGERVWIPSLRGTGEIISLDEAASEAEIQLGSFRLDLPLSRLRKPGLPDQPSPATPRVPERQATPAIHPSPGVELHLLGMRVEEMLPELERYIDEAYLAGLPWVRIVHGKGTGRLRQAVWSALKGYAIVVDQRLGEPGEGGDGVTVATMASA